MGLPIPSNNPESERAVADSFKSLYDELDDIKRRLKNLEGNEKNFHPGVSDYRFLQVRYFEYPSIQYIPSPYADAIYIEGVGGGGGGGGAAAAGATAAAGGGGGGGAYSATWLVGPLAAVYTINIGAAGAPSAAGNFVGGNGGDTTFDVVLRAKGGHGGFGDATAAIHVGGFGADGGYDFEGIGDLMISGGAGITGLVLAAAEAYSGPGGPSLWSGRNIGRDSTGAGNAGLAYGGGGSGGCSISSGAAQAGGQGRAGLLKIWEYTTR